MNKRSPFLVGFGSAGLLLWALLPSRAWALSAGKPEPDLAEGRYLYEENCARCHGLTGAGDGRDSALMFPKPRRVSEGIFKFRTTASGTPPTDEDLFHTLSTGLPGSGMPDFQRLPEDARWQIVHYLKTLSPVFQEQQPEPIDMGKDPGPGRVNLARGKQLYTELGCVACHGTMGRGDGPSAPTLVDNWGEPIRAADLTQGWSYRGGSTPKDVVARFMAGIDGTPMPSYADTFSSTEDAWHLAYYVRSIQESPQWGRQVVAVRAAGDPPSIPDDPAWEKAPRTDLRLGNTYYKGGGILPTTITALSIQALYDDTDVLFRLSWHDPQAGRETPPDALALFFLPDRREKFQAGSLRAWPAAQDAPALEVSYWSAAREAALGALIKEIQSVEAGEVGGTPLAAVASYAEGRWTLLLKKPLPALSEGPVLFGAAVWDGNNGESGRRRANSNWVDLVLQ